MEQNSQHSSLTKLTKMLVDTIPSLEVLQTKLVEYEDDRLATGRTHHVQRELRYCLVIATQLKSSGRIV